MAHADLVAWRCDGSACIKSRQTRGHVSGAAFASIVCESGRQNVNHAMSVPISDIVRRTIRHARRLAKHGHYDWPTSRVALTKILGDLEARSPGDPSLEKLRQVIERGDRAWRGGDNELK